MFRTLRKLYWFARDMYGVWTLLDREWVQEFLEDVEDVRTIEKRKDEPVVTRNRLDLN